MAAEPTFELSFVEAYLLEGLLRADMPDTPTKGYVLHQELLERLDNWFNVERPALSVENLAL